MPSSPARGTPRGSTSRSRPPALKRFGQNHLVDQGTMQAVVAMAAVAADDVVLEVGAADGALTRRLLDSAKLVHAYEIDRRFAPALEGLAGERENLRLHLGDALREPLGELDPAPTALVANLAFNIAIPLLMTTIAGLPSVERWAVMLQKELADRLFALPRSKPYAAVSVLTQLACRERARRAVPRTVFAPPPRVDSAFVVFERRDDWPRDRWPGLQALVRTAFGQRRKMLANSLGGAAHAGRTLTRDEVRRALQALDLRDDVRPEELTPPQFAALADHLGWA
jgi:16S rRNA (adenine1518-N6/adenine1519-N6)-dimethyltransferase